MTGPDLAGDPPAGSLPRAERALVAATTLLLFAAPFAASAGVRGGCLLLALVAWLAHRRAAIFSELAAFPRVIGIAYLAWATLAVASIGWTRNAAWTASELRPEILYGTGALLFFFVAARPARWPLWAGAIVLGTVLAAAGQAIQEHLGWRMSRHAIDGGPGAWSTHLVLIAPLVVLLALPRPWGFAKGRRMALLAALALGLAAWRSENRIVWFAFGVQLACVAATWGRLRLAGQESGRNLRLMAAIALLLVAAFAAAVIERGERHPAHAEATELLERDLRPKLWAESLRFFREAPWLGHGFGREILADRFEPLSPPEPHPSTRHAHNTFVNVALELGLAGLLAFCTLVAALLARYASLLRDPAMAPLGVAGIALVAGFFAKNLTDDFFFRHNALVFWAMNGALLGLAQRAAR